MRKRDLNFGEIRKIKRRKKNRSKFISVLEFWRF